VDPRSSLLVMRTSLLAAVVLAVLLLSSCAAADPPASSDENERAPQASVGDTETIRVIAADFYDEETVGFTEWSTRDDWVKWTCQVKTQQHRSQLAYRLLREMYLRYGSEKALEVSVIQPAEDGTGAHYNYYWNPSSRARSSNGTTMPAETIQGVFLVSEKPVPWGMATGRAVATITASPDQVREYAAEREPPAVTTTDVERW